MNRADFDPGNPDAPPLGSGGSALLFGGAAALLLIATHGLIPLLSARTEVEPVLLWFLVGGLGVLAPLVLVGLRMVSVEAPISRRSLWRERLRFRPMTLGTLTIVIC